MIEVRAYGPEDAEAFLGLYRDCLDHYETGPSRPDIEQQILAELSANYGTFADIAWNGSRAVGFTCWMRTFPARDAFAIYLKELYVTSSARGTGAGRALMRRLAEHAQEIGAVRITWGSYQPDALAFYDRIGATRDEYTTFIVKPDSYGSFAKDLDQ